MTKTLESQIREIEVKEIMSKSVLTIDSSVSANEAAKMMEDTKVSALVVTQNNSPIGIITERDFAVKVVAHAYPLDTPIRRIMSSPLIVISSEESVWVAADLMMDRKVHKLPVVENDQIVGIITKTDLIKQLSICDENEIKEKYIRSIADIYKHNISYL